MSADDANVFKKSLEAVTYNRDSTVIASLGDDPADYWVELWQKSAVKKVLPAFDMGEACPELIHILEVLKNRIKPSLISGGNIEVTESESAAIEKIPIPVTQNESKSNPESRPRVLIPGCGSGYDVVEWAKLGYDVTGIDVSAVAVKRAKGLIQKGKRILCTYLVKIFFETEGEKIERNCHMFQRDFFDFNPSIEIAAFDVVYDYAFCCSLPPNPSTRNIWYD